MRLVDSRHSMKLLEPDELGGITGGMFTARVVGQVLTKSTKMGDGTVEGQQWYKDRQQAEAAAKTAAAVAAAKAKVSDFDKIINSSPFAPRPIQVPKFTQNPFPGHPQARKG